MHTTGLRRAVGAVGALATAALVSLFTQAPAQAAPSLNPSGGGMSAGGTAPTVGEADVSTQELCADTGPNTFHCMSVVRTDLLDHDGLAPNEDPAGYHPADLQDAYNLPSASAGSGITVAIVDAFGYPSAEEDLGVYRTQFGLPPCTTDNGCFKKLDQRGGTDYPPTDPGWAWESALDVDMVSAVCPNCNIWLIEGDDNSFESLGEAVDKAVELGADYVSNSYGVDGENPAQVDFDHYYDHPGVGITVSSGDHPIQSWPATNPHVTSVGGTSLLPSDDERGWHETAWSAAGRGCSLFEPKPDFQTDPDCANRTSADVSTVADPATGVSVFSSLPAPGIPAGWQVFGGTSASAPMVAGIYALAGAPGAGEYPNTYPYESPDGLNDITEGASGSCGGSYLCTAVPGYDGPTGLGTPNGVTSFRAPGDRGELTGTVTDADSGDPISGATITAGDLTSVTDSNGQYDVSADAGTYDVTASAFGHESQTVTGVEVVVGEPTTVDFALAPSASGTISGTVTDGGGHGWPLHAQITVDGVDTGPIWSDPFTGHYEVTLPAGATYTLHVSPDVPGYQVATEDVEISGGDVNRNIQVTPDAIDCSAPGYDVHVDGVTESFDTADVPEGWTVTDNAGDGSTWRFTDTRGRGNLTGGEGGFAIVDSDADGSSVEQDTELITPSIDMSAMSSPSVGFKNDYRPFLSTSTADVDYSIDGGQTWTNVWEATTTTIRGTSEIALLPDAAGQSDVRVRFHYIGDFSFWWEIDEVFVGNRTCVPTHGGLVAGHITDRNTGDALNGADITSDDQPAEFGTSATSADPAVGAGYYWLFSSQTGSHAFTATKAAYTDATRSVSVGTNTTTRADFSLGAGHLVVSPGDITSEQQMGTTTTHTVDFTNDGSAPVDVTVGEGSGGFEEMLDQAGAPVQNIPGTYSNQMSASSDRDTTRQDDATPAEEPWTDIASLPRTIMDNTVVSTSDGHVYSFGGTTGLAPLSDSFAYDPTSDSWTRIADMPHPRQMAAATEFNGKIYLMSGWGDGANDLQPVTDVYDPATNSWSTASDAPAPMGASGHARLGNVEYFVGGCPTGSSCGSNQAWSYDLSSDSWTQIADYPESVAWESCAGISGAVYCAAGSTLTGTTTATYSYNPGTDSWTQMADAPHDFWGGAYDAANGMLIISGGVIDNSSTLTNVGAMYDPSNDTWSDLPARNITTYRTGGACGFYQVGGSDSGNFTPVAGAEVLPGFDECGGGDVPWLSEDQNEFTVQPGETVSVQVTLDASDIEVIDQPGDYTSALSVSTNSPYSVAPLGVTMTATPFDTWGKITGTVLGQSCDGTTAPVGGATVQIDTWVRSFTLHTDADGHFQLWLDWRHSPVTLIVAKDGWQPQFRFASIQALQTTTANFTLKAVC